MSEREPDPRPEWEMSEEERQAKYKAIRENAAKLHAGDPPLPKYTYTTEPADASGFTDDVEIITIEPELFEEELDEEEDEGEVQHLGSGGPAPFRLEDEDEEDESEET